MVLRGAVAVVTGASAGIGRATAVALAAEGASVVLAARREPLLGDLAGQIADRGGRALPVACDVTSWEQVDDLRSQVEHGLGRCDVLVNNAGVPGGGRFDDVSLEQVEWVVRTNYMGVVYCTKAFLPMMLAAGKGHVVNVASLAGLFPVPGSAVYSSTKHAVVAFSEALYFELADRGVLVTSVNPWLVRTEGFPQRERMRGPRVMQPEEVAAAIVDVLRRDRAPQRSVPRWLAAFQGIRALAPPLYRFGVRRAMSRLRPTRAGG
jgi:short-subunit dehydrogenase